MFQGRVAIYIVALGYFLWLNPNPYCMAHKVMDEVSKVLKIYISYFRRKRLFFFFFSAKYIK